MASGSAAFMLLANEGYADFALTATPLLQQRMQSIALRRKAAGYDSVFPTIGDIVKTHVLFTNSSYKPYVAITSEYTQQSTATGTVGFGSNVSFNLPTYGDFLYDIVINVVTNTLTPPTLTGVAAGDGNYPADTATVFYSLVDAFGTAVADDAAYTNLARWCEYPGIRLFEKVKLNLSSAPTMDEYSYYSAMLRMKFLIPPGKMEGYKTLVGQETECVGESGPKKCQVKSRAFQATTADAATAPNKSMVEYFGAAASNVYWDYARQSIKVLNGAQTPKPSHRPQSWWIPLLFWFGSDVRQAVPSASIPFGPRTVDILMANSAEMRMEYPNLFVKRVTEVAGTAANALTSFTLTEATPNTFLAGTYAFADSHVVDYTPYSSVDDTFGTRPDLTRIPTGTWVDTTGVASASMYVNNLFLNPEVHEIYLNRVGFLLVRLTREQKVLASTATSDTQLLSQLKWPVEFMFVGLRPTWNVNDANVNKWRDWHRMTLMAEGNVGKTALAYLGAGTPSGAAVVTSSVKNVVDDTYQIPVRSIATMHVTLHSIHLQPPAMEDKFYSRYVPYQFGGAAISTPEDPGALMINFSLYPGSFQPSGHVNVSRAREFYLTWTSDYITSTTTVDLFVSARAINFLLITDGTAVLRFTT